MYKVYELVIKEKMAGDPTIYIMGGHKVKLIHSGNWVRADELMAGDQIELDVPFAPGMFMNITSTFLKLKETKHTNKKDKGMRWTKK